MGRKTIIQGMRGSYEKVYQSLCQSQPIIRRPFSLGWLAKKCAKLLRQYDNHRTYPLPEGLAYFPCFLLLLLSKGKLHHSKPSKHYESLSIFVKLLSLSMSFLSHMVRSASFHRTVVSGGGCSPGQHRGGTARDAQEGSVEAGPHRTALVEAAPRRMALYCMGSVHAISPEMSRVPKAMPTKASF